MYSIGISIYGIYRPLGPVDVWQCMCVHISRETANTYITPVAKRLWYCVLTHSTTQISIGESAFFLVQRHSLLFRTGQGTHCRTGQDTHCTMGQDTHCRMGQDTHCTMGQDTHCRTGQDTHHRILYYFSASVEGMILHHSVIHTALSDTHRSVIHTTQ